MQNDQVYREGRMRNKYWYTVLREEEKKKSFMTREGRNGLIHRVNFERINSEKD
jgi:hypothetical protein